MQAILCSDSIIGVTSSSIVLLTCSPAYLYIDHGILTFCITHTKKIILCSVVLLVFSVDAGDCRPELRYCGSTLSAIGINPASVPGIPDDLCGRKDRHKFFRCAFGRHIGLSLIEQCDECLDRGAGRSNTCVERKNEFIFIKSAVQINEKSIE